MKATRRGFSKFIGIAALAQVAAISAWPTNVLAQSGKPLTLVVGYAPGGLTDLMGRLFASEFSKVINRQVVVENRPGANGNLATTYVAGAPNNGDTLLFTAGGQMVLNPNIYASLKVKPMEDLAPIGMVGEGDFIVATNTALGVKTMKEFIDLAKSKPGQLNYGTPGLGSFGHVLSELLDERAGISLKPVHYRGASLMLPELLANQVQIAVEGPTLMKENIAAGKLKGLMVFGKQRSKLAPDVPTAAEVGLQGLDGISNWFGVVGPKGMPAAVVAKYQEALQKVTASPEYAAKLEANGISVAYLPAADFAKKLAKETELFKRIAQSAHISAE